MVDVIVLGAGPTGLATSILLAQQGLDVMVFDRDGAAPDETRRGVGGAGSVAVSGSSGSCTTFSPGGGP